MQQQLHDIYVQANPDVLRLNNNKDLAFMGSERKGFDKNAGMHFAVLYEKSCPHDTIVKDINCF